MELDKYYNDGINNIMIYKNDKLVYKKRRAISKVSKKKTDYIYNYKNTTYYHPYYKNKNLHTIMSITKSIMSLLYGIAVQNGDIKISIIDDNINKYFQEYNEYFKNNKLRNKIKVKHLLTMTSGIKWIKKNDYNNPKHPTILMESSNNWLDYIFSKDMEYEPGEYFQYKDCDAVLLGEIFKKITNETLEDYANKYLFNILKIKSYYWKKKPDGNTDSQGGLYLSAESLAKIGKLVLNNGKINNIQLVSKKWLDISFINYKSNKKEKYGYGFQWWIYKNAIFGWGYKGQLLFIIPEKKIVAVINQWNNKNELVPYYFYNLYLKNL